MALAVVLATAAGTSGKEAQQVPERSEIPQKYLWATETIFPDKAAWDAEYDEVEKLMQKVSEFKGTLAKGPEPLLAALKFRDAIEPRIERVYVYASLLSDQDTRVGETQGMSPGPAPCTGR